MKTYLGRAAIVLIATAMFLLGAADAQAQNYSPSLPAVGPITHTSGVLTTEAGGGLSDNARAFQSVSAQPSATGTGGGDNTLAFTGSETAVLALSGFSLVLVGGAAIVASRRR